MGDEVCTRCHRNPARVSMDGVSLCDRCADRQIAAVTGYPELPDPPPDEELPGPDRRRHRMRFRVWRSPGGVVAEAEEVGFPAGEGYQVDVIGDHEVDTDHLLRALRERLRAEIGRLHLRRNPHRDGWMVDGTEVTGRLIWGAGGGSEDMYPYSVVVDGRTLTWEDLGRALEPFEGFRFRLTLLDTPDLDEGD